MTIKNEDILGHIDLSSPNPIRPSSEFRTGMGSFAHGDGDRYVGQWRRFLLAAWWVGWFGQVVLRKRCSNNTMRR